MTVLLGAIADDFTGATDLASMLVKGGMRVRQIIGVPDDEIDAGDAQAVVVALKSRTTPVVDAVEQSLASLAWLRKLGARQIFFKYCSTFDSTADGNIGPVADALMQALDCNFAFVCPAFPENGRTVYQGKLFVGEQLLSESPMKDHPLTPMRDADLRRLMDKQSKHPSCLIPLSTVQKGVDAIDRQIELMDKAGKNYGIVDAVSGDDLLAIGAAAANHKLITGGSGVAMGLPDNFRKLGFLAATIPAVFPTLSGRELVLAGSCSDATRQQIAYVSDNWPYRKISVDAIASGQDVVEELCDWTMRQAANLPALIYASSDPEEVSAVQTKYGVMEAGAMIENVMGELAKRLVLEGVTKIVIAGGETSGAVVSSLDIKALEIGPEIDPGVPWTTTRRPEGDLALALKSGNFGTEDFFEKAFQVLQ